MLKNRVAITGIGIVSCLGCDAVTVGSALKSGKSGIVIDEERISLGFRSPLTGSISSFDPCKHLNRKQRKTMPDFAVWAHSAAMDALLCSGLKPEDIRNDESGLIFGCDSSTVASIEGFGTLKREAHTSRIGSGVVFRAMTSTVTMNLNTIFKTRGACWSISSACSSGGHAVGQAADLISIGRQKVIICGGAQEINPESMCAFDGLGAFSTRIEEPEKASKPFDAERDGLIPSGGAAALMLEDYGHAVRRGADILGEVISYAFSSDGNSISVPDGNGLFRAMSKALDLSGITPEEVDYVCAHATSTPIGDTVEAEAIFRLFGEKSPPVSSLKSMTGHELWMSGASQAVYTTIMNMQGFIAPNINFRSHDPDTPEINIISEAIDGPPKLALCNSAGFGGTNSCLLLKFSA